ncbi:MAG: DnaB-like helicase C-terminal domain-containing protein, partial [bacterium]
CALPILKGIVLWGKNKGSAGDNVYDISRILRLPGYYHQKEEPYLCDFIHKSNKKYSYEELQKFFPFEEKEYFTKKINTANLGLIDREIENIDFKELIIRAFNSVGRQASFDNQDRLILDNRQTGTFQGRRDNRQYLASSSHEPFKGNKITAVADIIGITNKEARRWIIDEYGLDYSVLAVKQKVNKQLEKIEKPIKKCEEKRFTWGTRYLDTHFAIIKPSNFIVVGAKRSAGKTTYTFDMACKNALLGHKVLYISLEMDTEDILDDFGRKYSGITIEEEFDKKIPDIKKGAYEKKKKELKEISNLFFEGIRRSGDISWETIVAVIDKHKEVDMIFLDNLDLIAGLENENEFTRQRRIVKSIMAFTSDRQIPFVLIHHYRKSNAGKDYGMDELSGSGKIADGADRVVRISRNPDFLAPYPENCISKIYLQKGRGYPEHAANIYFIKGTFLDNLPEGIDVEEVVKIFNGKVIYD